MNQFPDEKKAFLKERELIQKAKESEKVERENEEDYLKQFGGKKPSSLDFTQYSTEEEVISDYELDDADLYPEDKA
jgi:hypothetical protein